MGSEEGGCGGLRRRQVVDFYTQAALMRLLPLVFLLASFFFSCEAGGSAPWGPWRAGGLRGARRDEGQGRRSAQGGV